MYKHEKMSDVWRMMGAKFLSEEGVTKLKMWRIRMVLDWIRIYQYKLHTHTYSYTTFAYTYMSTDMYVSINIDID